MLTGLEALEFANNVENELAVLTSYTLVSNTLFLLDFDVSYYYIKNDFLGKILGNSAMTRELYTSSPFKIVLDKTHVQPINSYFYISVVNDSVFMLETSIEKPYLYNYLDGGLQQTGPIQLRKLYRFGQMIDTSFCRFSVIASKERPAGLCSEPPGTGSFAVSGKYQGRSQKSRLIGN